MALNADYKKDKRLTIGFNKMQMQSLKILESYGVNLSQFIRIAISEKLKKDWSQIKEQKEKIKYPF